MKNCHKCDKPFPTRTQANALKKTRANDPEKFEELKKKLAKKVCMCPDPRGSSFTSSQQPSNLDWHDKHDQ